MHNRLLTLFIYLPPIIALIGGAIFVGGLLSEVSAIGANSNNSLSPSIQVALAGLCLGAFMFFVWFGSVGWLLLRQSRRQGSGYGDAYRLLESFQFREAIPLLERSISEGKETPQVLMLLTSAYAYAGQLGKAQATADRAVRLFPNDPESYVTLANGYRLQGVYDEAARALSKAAELEPRQAVVWAELGFVQLFSGDQTAAIQSFEQAARYAMPAMYGVRVYYHLSNAYAFAKDTPRAVNATAKMMSARDGLKTWLSG